MSYYSRAIGYIQLHHTLPVHKTKRKVCAFIHVHAYLIGLPCTVTLWKEVTRDSYYYSPCMLSVLLHENVYAISTTQNHALRQCSSVFELLHADSRTVSCMHAVVVLSRMRLI